MRSRVPFPQPVTVLFHPVAPRLRLSAPRAALAPAVSTISIFSLAAGTLKNFWISVSSYRRRRVFNITVILIVFLPLDGIRVYLRCAEIKGGEKEGETSGEGEKRAARAARAGEM